jgi:hypothetical protein
MVPCSLLSISMMYNMMAMLWSRYINFWNFDFLTWLISHLRSKPYIYLSTFYSLFHVETLPTYINWYFNSHAGFNSKFYFPTHDVIRQTRGDMTSLDQNFLFFILTENFTNTQSHQVMNGSNINSAQTTFVLAYMTSNSCDDHSSQDKICYLVNMYVTTVGWSIWFIWVFEYLSIWVFEYLSIWVFEYLIYLSIWV